VIVLFEFRDLVRLRLRVRELQAGRLYPFHRPARAQRAVVRSISKQHSQPPGFFGGVPRYFTSKRAYSRFMAARQAG
jgi:hypothetical protein